MSFASMGVLICCLLLMGSAALVSVNISSAMGWLGDQNAVMVFLGDDVTAELSDSVKTQIEAVGNIKTIEFVSREDAFASIMSKLSDDASMVDALSDTAEFLPNAYKVTFDDLSRFEVTVDQIKQIEKIQHVSDKRDFVKRLNGINKVVSVVGLWIVGMLFVVSLFIITNTIKLTMYVRKLEIGIMKSVGATDWFIRLPFLVEGIIIGLFSGIVSFGLVTYVYLTASSAVTSTFTIGIVPYSSFWWIVLLGFLFTGMFAGSSGSLISIRKYLKNDGGISND
jgi:cell division transport system permease protein